MTEAEVIEAKEIRRAARSVFDTQRDLVRADLGAASLGKRVANRLVEDGRFMAEEAAGAAERHKALAAAGALTVTGLLLRKPLMAFASSVLGLRLAEDEETEAEDQSEPSAKNTES